MSRQLRFVVLSGVLLLALLVNLAYPVTVYADDGTPPPPTTEEPVQPPAEGEIETVEEEADPAATEAPVVEEPLATEVPVATQVPGESADGLPPIVEKEGSPDELTVSEVLQAVPEGTKVVVLDENGEALPLVTQEAAQIIQSGDPMWCPVGVAPQAGVGGCTDPGWNGVAYTNYDPTSFVDLVFNYLRNNQPNQAGVIWIERAYDSSAEGVGVTPFIMQGSGALNFSLMSQHALTIQGGWTGDSAGTIDHSQPSIFAGNALQIIDWTGAITIRDIEFRNTDAIGLLVQTQGDITLSNVEANGNAMAGAELDSGSNIDIRSSTFGAGANHGNGLFGLNTSAAGSTTLVDVIASGNGIGGAMLSHPAGFGGPVTVSESHFDGNGALGLLASSSSSITLSNVTASDNIGLFFPLPGAALMGDGPITVTESHFDRNGFGGLLVSSGSDVSLSAMTANGNAFFGANADAAGSLSVSHSYFDGNMDPGGEAIGLGMSSDQSINLDHVSASNNEGGGVLLDSWGDAAIICSVFNGNQGIGLDGFLVGGTFTLNDVTFGGNGTDYDGTPVFANGGCKIVNGKNHRSPALPLHIVPVNGGESVELNCTIYSGTEMVLPNGDRVVLHCPFMGEVVLTGQTQDELKGQLGSQYNFLSAMNVEVKHGGEIVKTVHPEMTVDFVIPEGQQGTNLAILFWDGSQWFELPDVFVTANGFFQARTNYTGYFVLVKK